MLKATQSKIYDICGIFYSEYFETPELFEIAKTVRWSTNLIIMYKVKDLDERKFYLKLASDTMCSRSTIELQIKSSAYERECLSNKKHNFQSTLPDHLASKADNLLKAGYFLEVNKPFFGSHSLLEKQIENEMVDRIKEVIMMLGKGFAFIGNQYRIVAKGNEYFIDLLFFNRILRSLFAVELKAKKFKAEYAGKMNLYLGLLDDYVNQPMGIAEIKLSKILPKELVGKLPDPKELENEILNKIEGLDDVEDDEES